MKTLEEMIKNIALLMSSLKKDMEIYSHNFSPYKIEIIIHISFQDILFNDSKEMYKILKPFIYYVYSLTYKTNFLRDRNLLVKQISFSYSDERNIFDHTFNVCKRGHFSDIESIREFNKNLSKNYDNELVNKGYFLLILYVD